MYFFSFFLHLKVNYVAALPVLLHKANCDHDDNGEGDAGGIVELLHGEADKGRAEEEDDERVLELFQVLLPHRLLLPHHQLVQPEGLVPAQVVSTVQVQVTPYAAQLVRNPSNLFDTFSLEKRLSKFWAKIVLKIL